MFVDALTFKAGFPLAMWSLFPPCQIKLKKKTKEKKALFTLKKTKFTFSTVPEIEI